MKILVVAATEGEIRNLRGILGNEYPVRFLITGVGMVATAYALGTHLRDNNYNLAINCGLAGSFDAGIPLGEVVNVTEDEFSELGAEDGDKFLTLHEIGLAGKAPRYNSYDDGMLPPGMFRNVRGITVNTVHGRTESISKIMKRLNPQVESMEGAAFFYVCSKEHLPAIQLRAISNYVEQRDKTKWNIPLALRQLEKALTALLENIYKHA